MFKWTKVHYPLGGEKYIVSVGDVWGGVVQSHPCQDDTGKFYWEASYTVCGQQVSGQSGGGLDRDYGMDWVEGRIIDALAGIELVRNNPRRRIFSTLVEPDPVTGGWKQEELL